MLVLKSLNNQDWDTQYNKIVIQVYIQYTVQQDSYTGIYIQYTVQQDSYIYVYIQYKVQQDSYTGIYIVHSATR